MGTTQHEQYLRGELLQGVELGDDDAPKALRAEDAGHEHELSGDEREDLRRLTTERGWPVLLKLLDRRIRKLEDDAKNASKVNPFEPNLPKIWARVSSLEAAKQEILILLENEIQKLTESGTQDYGAILGE